MFERKQLGEATGHHMVTRGALAHARTSCFGLRTLAEVGAGEHRHGQQRHQLKAHVPHALALPQVKVAQPLRHLRGALQVLVHVGEVEHVLMHSTHDLHAYCQ